MSKKYELTDNTKVVCGKTLYQIRALKDFMTATPDPNKYKELIHYAGYLEIMDTGQALTRFFQRDSTKANNLTIYPHKEKEFWLWVSSWALFYTKPSDLSQNYSDEGYDLPKLIINKHRLVTKNACDSVEPDGQLKMVCAPASWSDSVWDDINRMRTLNSEQSRRNLQMHVCPLQIDTVERLIDRYSSEGDTVLDFFGGIMTVPYMAVKMGRYGIGIELNSDYFRDGLAYLKSMDAQCEAPTLFDFISEGA